MTEQNEAAKTQHRIKIKSLIDEISGLQVDCDLRSRDLLADDLTREKAKAASGAYGYCILRLRDLM
jgi:hypothetical protein